METEEVEVEASTSLIQPDEIQQPVPEFVPESKNEAEATREFYFQ